MTTEDPFVLSAGERRSYTANTIIRDPGWRKRDFDGALRMCPADAERLDVAGGDRVTVATKAGRAEAVVEISDAMQPGHVSLPNGLGLDWTDDGGESSVVGVALNELTSLDNRDAFTGVPLHKHVPARVERLAAAHGRQPL